MNLPEQLRIADIFDILVVAAVIFVALKLLRQRSFRSAVIGLGVMLAALLTANATDMVMTRWLAQALIVLLGVTAVVVFQGDLRNAFDRLTALRMPDQPRFPGASDLAETVTSTCSHMAERRTGALLAFQGREDWDRFITGGVALDARPSKPLLLSLFQPPSPAHDGAILVSRGRLTHFGAHLPLSRNLEAVGSGGTRHTAALGLSERCDAFVAVVSEERGTISVARGGTLHRIQPNELARQLDDFLRDGGRTPADTSGSQARHNLLAGALSIFAAAVLWFVLVLGAPLVTTTAENVPLEFLNVPADRMLEDPPATVALKLQGRQNDVDQLDKAKLALSFDLFEVEVGRQELDPRQGELRGARGFELRSVTPNVIELEVIELQTSTLPIRPAAEGKLPEGLQLERYTCVPATIEIWIPAEDEAPDSVGTLPIDLSAIRETTRIERRIVLPEGCRPAEGQPETVTVTVHVTRKEN